MLNRDVFKAAAALCALLVLGACVHRGPQVTNYFIGQQCHVEAWLKDCDHDEPPHCKKVVVKYTKACEQIEAKDAKR